MFIGIFETVFISCLFFFFKNEKRNDAFSCYKARVSSAKNSHEKNYKMKNTKKMTLDIAVKFVLMFFFFFFSPWFCRTVSLFLFCDLKKIFCTQKMIAQSYIAVVRMNWSLKFLQMPLCLLSIYRKETKVNSCLLLAFNEKIF